jgi:tetratricopeptide repeat protein
MLRWGRLKPWARIPSSVVAVGAVLVVLSAFPAAAAGASAARDARRIYDEATAAFGLGKYAEAAEKYEAAFAIRPDPALLYNAAQAYRLGGIKPRALELYRNYVRLYPDGTNAADARTHAEALKKAIDVEAANPPPKPVTPPPPKPVTPLPSAAAPPPASSPAPGAGRAMPAPVETTAPPAAAPAPAAAENVPMVSRPGQAGDEPPLTKQTWFWVATGAGVVLVGAMVILAISGGGVTYPEATYGTVRGN